MKKALHFIPVRLNDDEGINLFTKELILFDKKKIVFENIQKEISFFRGKGFLVEYSEYLSPTKFVIVSFIFENDEYLQQFINSNYFHIKGLINITNNPLFEDISINNKSVCNNKFIIEGVKGVGKTSLIIYAINHGIICLDRDMQIISNNNNDISKTEKTALDFYNYIHKENNLYCIFLINHNYDELIRRINYRNMIKEKDIISEKYQDYSRIIEYMNKYDLLEKYMRNHGLIDSRIDFVNCTYDNLDNQNNKILKIMRSK